MDSLTRTMQEIAWRYKKGHPDVESFTVRVRWSAYDGISVEVTDVVKKNEPRTVLDDPTHECSLIGEGFKCECPCACCNGICSHWLTPDEAGRSNDDPQPVS